MGRRCTRHLQLKTPSSRALEGWSARECQRVRASERPSVDEQERLSAGIAEEKCSSGEVEHENGQALGQSEQPNAGEANGRQTERSSSRELGRPICEGAEHQKTGHLTAGWLSVRLSESLIARVAKRPNPERLGCWNNQSDRAPELLRARETQRWRNQAFE